MLATTAEAAGIVYAEVDVAQTEEPRASIPVFAQRRRDLYQLRWLRGAAGPLAAVRGLLRRVRGWPRWLRARGR